VLLVTPPPRFELGPLPTGARLVRGARSPLDVVVLFCTTHRDLRRRFGKLADVLAPAGRLWVAWPKKTAGVPTDLTFQAVQETGLAGGLVDNKSASLDPVFQGLQFVRRLRDRRPE
jgi:hypothetical protein